MRRASRRGRSTSPRRACERDAGFTLRRPRRTVGEACERELQLELGDLFRDLPRRGPHLPGDAPPRHRLDAGDRARGLVHGACASARSSASSAPRPIPGWCGSATPMSSCSATFRCWCRCSCGTSCCPSCCRPTRRLAQAASATHRSTPPWSRSASTPRRASPSRCAPASRASPAASAWPALALGLTLPQTYGYVLLPMAYRIILPPLTSEFLNIIKNSAVALTIGLMELTARARAMQEFTFQVFEAFTAATVIYIVDQYRGDVRDALGRAPRRRARPDRRRAASRQPLRQQMFADFDFDVIIRSLPYLFYDGMTFTLMLTALATIGGIFFGTLLALMRLSGIAPLALLAAGYVNLMRSVPLVLMIFWFYFLVPYIGAMDHRRGAADPGGRVRLLARHLHAVRSGVFLRDHARRHPVDLARPGGGGAGARHDLSADHGLHRAAAGLPQHGAGAAHPDHHPVPGHLAGLRALDHRLPRRRLQGRAARRPAGGDVPVRRRGLFRDLVRGLPGRAMAAGAGPPSSAESSAGSRSRHDYHRPGEQVVRQLPGARALLDRGRQGRGGGGVRALRLRQVDADQVRQRARAVPGRRHHRRRHLGRRSEDQPAQAARAHRHGVPAFRAVSAPT